MLTIPKTPFRRLKMIMDGYNALTEIGVGMLIADRPDLPVLREENRLDGGIIQWSDLIDPATKWVSRDI